MYQSHNGFWSKQFLNDNKDGSELRAFWTGVRKSKDPRLEGHDIGKDGWGDKAIPASLHGNAVPCITVGKPETKSYNVYSLAGILAKGSTL